VKREQEYFFREWFIYILLSLIALLIFSKLFYLHIINADELKARGATLRDNNQTMIYERGMIVDAQGTILAKSVAAKDIYADPKALTSYLTNKNKNITSQELTAARKDIAAKIALILNKDDKNILDLISKDLSWVSLARQIDLDKANEISKLQIPGIGFTDTYKRIYPAGTMGSSILGIVNMAGDGVEGLEYSYNEELNGEKVLKTSSANNAKEEQFRNNVQTGYNLSLTLDSTIQHLVEQELDSIIKDTHPARAVILAMDPKSGKILGMGSRPTFDPNAFANTKAEDRKNLAIGMIYEPGSTFKIITGAAALEEGVVTPDTKYNDPGYIVVGSRKITNWDSDQKAHGLIPFADGMKLSSNVVLAQVGQSLGKESFYTYLKSFGFGSKTKIDIAGEEQGLLLNIKNVKNLELSTMSFGQANLVTPIQLLTGICAVANGGNLMQPYIVDKITAKNGEVLQTNKPKMVGQVISPTTSKTMTDILVSVVDNGTGSRAKILGVKVAGKTGTAQKIDPKTGQYSNTDYMVSFVGYAPADDPKIAVLVIIDTPKAAIVQGGTLSGPHVKEIIESTLQYYGIPVSAGTPSNIVNLSDLTPANDNPKTVTPENTPGEGEVVVPNVIGLTIRQAGEELGKKNLRYRFAGTGLATKQFPEPGKVINQGDTVEVIFSAGDN